MSTARDHARELIISSVNLAEIHSVLRAAVRLARRSLRDLQRIRIFLRLQNQEDCGISAGPHSASVPSERKSVASGQEFEFEGSALRF